MSKTKPGQNDFEATDLEFEAPEPERKTGTQIRLWWGGIVVYVGIGPDGEWYAPHDLKPVLDSSFREGTEPERLKAAAYRFAGELIGDKV